MVPFVLLLKCASSKICFFSSFLSLCPSGFAFERVARLRQEVKALKPVIPIGVFHSKLPN